MRVRVTLSAITTLILAAVLVSVPVQGVDSQSAAGTTADVKREMKRLSSSRPTERALGAFRLGHMGHGANRAVRALIRLLKDDSLVWMKTGSKEPEFRDASAPQSLYGDEVFVYALQVGMSGFGDEADSELTYVARVASDALGRMGVDAVPPLLEVLSDDRPLVRSMAASALGGIGEPRAGQPLLGLLGDAHPGVRLAAAESLATMRDPAAVTAWLDLLKDNAALVRREAAKHLGTSHDPRAGEALYRLLKEDPEPSVRASAVRAFVETGDPRGLEALLVALHDREWVVCEAASEKLGSLKDPRSVEPLIDVLKEEDNPLARERANAALRTITGQDFGVLAERWSEWWKKHSPDVTRD